MSTHEITTTAGCVIPYHMGGTAPTKAQIARRIGEFIAREEYWWPQQPAFDVETGAYEGDMEAGHVAANVANGQYMVVAVRKGQQDPIDMALGALGEPDEVADAAAMRYQTDIIWRRAIKDALLRGESAISIAARAGISRARVYQIRDGRR